MRIPQSIEWRVGALLVLAVGLVLALVLSLSVIRADIGLAAQGTLRFEQGTWRLVALVAPEQIETAYNCRHVRIKVAGQYLYAPIDSLHCRLRLPEAIEISFPLVESRILDWSALRRQPLSILLLQDRNLPLVQVLYRALFKRTGGV